VSIDLGDVKLIQLRQHMERTFRQLATDKALAFTIEIDPELPETMRTDEKRLQQVVLNLLSNAFKFTARGEVKLRFGLEDAIAGRRGRAALRRLSVAVTDTGIGIPEDKQKLIFEAFQQADGTTSRKYGGTGLGLSISREIANLLGGELRVQSTPGKGSTFTLVVPLDGPKALSLQQSSTSMGELGGVATNAANEVVDSDDRNDLQPGDKVILIVEDDPTFGRVLLSVARSAGLKAVLSTAGSGTLALTRKIMPDAVTLDLGLSDIDGWVLFDLLQHDPKTASIPIHVISGAENAAALMEKGAATVMLKPVDEEELTEVFGSIREQTHRDQRNVLVVDADLERRLGTTDAIRDGLTTVTAVDFLPANADEAALHQYSHIVVSVGRSPAQERSAVANLARQNAAVLGATVIYGPGAEALLASSEYTALKQLRHAANLSQLTQLLERSATPIAGDNDQVGVQDLVGTKVLIIDDDIRNIYSLTSLLETCGIEVLHAEGGREGIELLERHTDTHVALVDIMMPEMDGYETMREIRNRPAMAHIPLIAVTAKAMKGDRQKCLDAGASDYIAKPVDLDLLLALLRVWIDRSRSRTASDSTAIGA
ncbi:MAG: putative sensory histidine kinase, partial [Devosia sp.]|nr:putative sensory histidine kinase [Devosia sp.]